MKKSCDLLITNGIVVTVDRDNRIFDLGAVAVRDQKIIFTGSAEGGSIYKADETIDAANCIIMPGIVNAHCHSPMSLFRGLADDIPLMTWLNDYMFKAEAEYINAENAFCGALLSCLEMLMSGTTLFCDGYFHEEAVAKAVISSGIKGVIGQGVIDFPAPGVPDPSINVNHAYQFAENQKNIHSRITPSIFCHSPYTCSLETLTGAKKAADKSGVLFQIHVSETREENTQSIEKHGETPVKYLYRNGLLDRNTLLVHCVWMDHNDMDLIKKTGSSIVHCPESNMKLGSGIAPVAEFIKKGIITALGTDGCASNNNLDIFSEMDTAAKLQKVRKLDPSVLNAMTALKMATINGAKALGKEKETGSIEIGKRADIIILDTDKPHLIPMYNPISHIVYSASGSDVRDVIIDGSVVVRDRVHKTLNTDDIFERVKMVSEKISVSRGKLYQPDR